MNKPGTNTMKEKNSKTYLIHTIYATSLLISTLILVGYYNWRQVQLRAEKQHNKSKLVECMLSAEKNYEISISNLCTDKKINCKFAIGYFTPKLLDPIISTLKNEQSICIKTFT